MSKDHVRLLRLQAIGTSPPRSQASHEGVDQSFVVIKRELDALASKVSIASEVRDELERKVASQADELRSLRQALEVSDARCHELEEEVNGLRAELNRGLDPTEESDTDGEPGEAGPLIEAMHPLGNDFSPPPAMSKLPANPNMTNFTTEWKSVDTDWSITVNPNVNHLLDITLVRTFNHESPAQCVRISPDMKSLAAACGTTVHMYDAVTGKETWTLPTGNVVQVICFSSDGSMLAVGGQKEKLDVIVTATRKICYTFGGNTAGISSLCFSSNGKLLVAGCYNNTARIWTLENGACNIISTRSGSILSITHLPKRLIALGCINGSVEIWKTNKKGANLNLMETIVGHKDAVKSLAFVQLAGKRKLVIASEDSSLKYLDVSRLLDTKKALANHRQMAGGNPLVQCIMRFQVTGNKESVTSIAVSPDRKWVVSGSDDHCIQFCDLEAATLHSVIHGHNDSVTSVDFSQTGKILVTGGKDGKVRMWAYE